MLFPLAKVHISPSKHQELHFTKNSHFHSEAQKEFTKSSQKTRISFFIIDLNAFCKKEKTFIDEMVNESKTNRFEQFALKPNRRYSEMTNMTFLEPRASSMAMPSSLMRMTPMLTGMSPFFG